MAVLIASAGAEADSDVTPPAGWRAEVAARPARPDLDPADQAFLRMMVAWRAPGTDAPRRLREVGWRACRI